MKTFRLILVSFLSALFAACSGGGGSSGGAAAVDGKTSDAGLVMGSYSTGCSNPSANLYYKYDVYLTSNTIQFTTYNYATGDTTCATAGYSIDSTHSYTSPGKSQTDADAALVNITVGKVYVTPLVGGAVTAMNSNALCGISNWQLNVKRDITGTSCEDDAPGTVVYSISKTVSGVLYIGGSDGTNDGSTEPKRHIIFNTLTYNKK